MRRAGRLAVTWRSGGFMDTFLAGLVGASCLMAAASAVAQPVVYPAEEFAARRAALCESVGEGYVLMFGASNLQPVLRFRQANDFYYLTGVEDLNAAVLINVEPMIAIDDEQIHARIEDTVLVTEDGAEVLSADLPKEVDEVLALVGHSVGVD